MPLRRPRATTVTPPSVPPLVVVTVPEIRATGACADDAAAAQSQTMARTSTSRRLMALVSASAGGQKRVEQQAERGQGLAAMLDPKPQQNHLSVAHLRLHDGGPSGDGLPRLQPAAQQQIPVR